jgi:hypothetical protein
VSNVLQTPVISIMVTSTGIMTWDAIFEEVMNDEREILRGSLHVFRSPCLPTDPMVVVVVGHEAQAAEAPSAACGFALFGEVRVRAFGTGDQDYKGSSSTTSLSPIVQVHQNKPDST